jgi:5-formyltetrahydrofolate cyclo-ligase
VAEPHRPRATGPDPAKLALRDQIITARNRLAVAELGAAGAAITSHLLAQPEVRRAATVAAYVSTASEPGTGILLDALVDAGKRVILPVLRPDDDLDWAVYEDESALLPARRGILEPAGRRLGIEAVATADVVLVPGLAVSHDGVRLGRGGGSYDRALARVPAGTFTCVLLHEGEVGRDVPVAQHDRAVAAAATPRGITRFRRGPG